MTAVVIRESRGTSGNKLPQFDQSTRKKKKKKKSTIPTCYERVNNAGG